MIDNGFIEHKLMTVPWLSKHYYEWLSNGNSSFTGYLLNKGVSFMTFIPQAWRDFWISEGVTDEKGDILKKAKIPELFKHIQLIEYINCYDKFGGGVIVADNGVCMSVFPKVFFHFYFSDPKMIKK